MKYLKQLLVILCVSFIGEMLHHYIPLPIPASIYGIVLMFVFLSTGVIPISAVRETGLFLVNIMPVMFISPAAGVITISNQIGGKWVIYLVIVILSTIVVMGASGVATQSIQKLIAPKQGKKKPDYR